MWQFQIELPETLPGKWLSPRKRRTLVTSHNQGLVNNNYPDHVPIESESMFLFDLNSNTNPVAIMLEPWLESEPNLGKPFTSGWSQFG